VQFWFRFWGEFSHHPSIMSLLFFPRGLDEMGFEVLGEPRESAGHRWLMPSGNTDIHAPEKWKCSPAAFASGA
jgi:hypothetical protein